MTQRQATTDLLATGQKIICFWTAGDQRLLKPQKAKLSKGGTTVPSLADPGLLLVSPPLDSHSSATSSDRGI